METKQNITTNSIVILTFVISSLKKPFVIGPRGGGGLSLPALGWVEAGLSPLGGGAPRATAARLWPDGGATAATVVERWGGTAW